MLSAIVLLLLVVLAQSCMKMRTSDTKARKEFQAHGIDLITNSIEIDGQKLHYAQAGFDSLPTLFFIHGSPGSWDAFKNYLLNKQLLQRYRIISIDRPGFGYSSFGKALNLQQQTQVISKFIRHVFRQQPVTLIGHSLGGPLAVKLAAACASMVDNLVILAGSNDPAAEKPEKWRRVLLTKPLCYLLPGAFRPSNQELWYLKNDLKSLDKDLAQIACPVYILHGNKDVLVPYSNAGYTKKMLTNTDSVFLTTFPSENHFIVWTKQQEIINLLLSLQ